MDVSCFFSDATTEEYLDLDLVPVAPGIPLDVQLSQNINLTNKHHETLRRGAKRKLFHQFELGECETTPENRKFTKDTLLPASIWIWQATQRTTQNT